MDQVRNELALANAQELISVRGSDATSRVWCSQADAAGRVRNGRAHAQKMNEHCFTACVPKPGSRLDSSESVCWAGTRTRTRTRNDGGGRAAHIPARYVRRRLAGMRVALHGPLHGRVEPHCARLRQPAPAGRWTMMDLRHLSARPYHGSVRPPFHGT